MRVRAPPPAPTNLVIDQRLHATGQPWGHHGATPRRPAQRRSAGNWRASVPLHSSACPPPVALPQAPAVAGGTRRRPAAGKATAPGDHFPGAVRLHRGWPRWPQGRPSRMAPARRPAQVDGPTDSVTRVHSGIAWGCGGPCLAPPAGAVRLTAKAGLPTPGLSLAIGRYCLSESLRPTVVSRRKPGGQGP
jgi:hypothetical protein